jgi:hypothetical protein
LSSNDSVLVLVLFPNILSNIPWGSGTSGTTGSTGTSDTSGEKGGVIVGTDNDSL